MLAQLHTTGTAGVTTPYKNCTLVEGTEVKIAAKMLCGGYHLQMLHCSGIPPTSSLIITCADCMTAPAGAEQGVYNKYTEPLQECIDDKQLAGSSARAKKCSCTDPIQQTILDSRHFWISHPTAPVLHTTC